MSPKTRGHFDHAQTVCTRRSLPCSQVQVKSTSDAPPPSSDSPFVQVGTQCSSHAKRIRKTFRRLDVLLDTGLSVNC